jgi:hypothetical protein
MPIKTLFQTQRRKVRKEREKKKDEDESGIEQERIPRGAGFEKAFLRRTQENEETSFS